jgi:ubiquinone/menaquinone biosynthesis C-methylase UbiE
VSRISCPRSAGPIAFYGDKAKNAATGHATLRDGLRCWNASTYPIAVSGTSHYLIRGGVQGRERLRIVSRVMRPSTTALLQRAGIRPGMTCLDAGCGGGDVAFDMARMVVSGGKVVGTDIDEAKLALARAEAMEQNLQNLEFRFGDVLHDISDRVFDFVHARFLLTHVPSPADALTKMWHALRPGGTLVVEDIDFSGYFCYPANAAFWRYVDLYTRTAERRHSDANLGPRLPSLLTEAGFANVQMSVVQHASTVGEVKILSALTMENIADSVLSEGLANRDEIDSLIAELYEFARTPGTIGCSPRIFEVWGQRPVS